MPTEEVFTLPDRNRADGVISATFPLSYGGTLIEDFQVHFENGRITKVTAKKGEAALQKLVETDEGSRRLGEVALVPASSPIGKRGHLFYNTLFDENASCHIAFGNAYRTSIDGGADMTEEDFAARGGTPANVNPIPPVEQEMGMAGQFLNDAAQSPVGAGVAGFADAMTAGIPISLMGAQGNMNRIREMNPGSAFMGEMAGSVAGTMLGGAGLKAGSAALGASPRLAALLANPMTTEVGYGATYGATQGGLEGAAVGAVIQRALEQRIGKVVPGGQGGGAHRTREGADLLGFDRVAFERHGR
jgi:hypothetical protein